MRRYVALISLIVASSAAGSTIDPVGVADLSLVAGTDGVLDFSIFQPDGIRKDWGIQLTDNDLAESFGA